VIATTTAKAISRAFSSSVVKSQTPAIAPTRLEPVSPSIARSPNVNQAPDQYRAEKDSEQLDRFSGPGPDAKSQAKQDQGLLGPPRTQVDEVEQVRGKDQQRDVGEVLERL